MLARARGRSSDSQPSAKRVSSKRVRVGLHEKKSELDKTLEELHDSLFNNSSGSDDEEDGVFPIHDEDSKQPKASTAAKRTPEKMKMIPPVS